MCNMVRKLWISCIVLMYVTYVLAKKGGCLAQPGVCECDFETDSESWESDAETKSRVMAGAVGVLAPILVTGAGLGIWKLAQGMSTPESRLPYSLAESDSDPETEADGGNSPVHKSPGGTRPASVLSITERISFTDDMSDRGSSVSLYSHDNNPYTSPDPSDFVDPRGSPSSSHDVDINAWMNSG